MLAPRLCLGMGRAMNLNTIKRIAYASSVMLALLATPGLIAVDHFVSDGNQVHVKALLYFLFFISVIISLRAYSPKYVVPVYTIRSILIE